MTDNELAQLLDSEARRINNRGFIDQDPVQFPRRFTRKEDIEIVSLLVATISWGNRKMICRNCDKMLGMMADDPYHFVMEGAFEEIDDRCNIHRTFFGENMKRYLRGLKLVYSRHGSVEDMAVASGATADEQPAWQIAECLNRSIAEANDGRRDSRCLPTNVDKTALKRINMALRWLVRDDGIVDMGVWKAMKPSQLYIPLDVHVADVSRELGLLDRRSNDRRAVVELTERLRHFNADDPTIYDYALFGIGMNL